jgi:hypothetical protein
VRTGIAQGIHLPVVPGEHDGGALDLHLAPLPFGELVCRQHGGERPRYGMQYSMEEANPSGALRDV